MKLFNKFLFQVFISIFIFNLSIAQKTKEKKTSGSYDFQGAYFENRARVKQGLKWGFVDKNNTLVVKLKYNEVENFKDGLAKVRKEHFWGMVDTMGIEIIPVAFDWIGDFEGDRAKVIRLGEKGYIDKTGKMVGR